MNGRRTRRLVLAVAVLALVGSAAREASAAGAEPVAPPANSAASPDPAPRSSESQIDPAAAALARQKGITIAQAKARLARERTLGNLGARIEKSLAGRSGGTYLDTSGNLVVTTLDTASNAVAARSGARAQLVDDSSARLDAIMGQLDRQAAKTGAGAVQGWYVDVPRNTVVVTVTQGASDARTAAMRKLAARFGDSVRIESRPASQAPKPAEWLAGGYQFNQPNGAACSVGFNTLDRYNNNIVLTAGHCVRASGWITRNGYTIGAVRTANYGGDDFGTFWNNYPGYWQPSPSVYRYDTRTYIRVVGQWNNPPTGATVCKSGLTTGYTCGTITAPNQTVVYIDGTWLSGLVRHNACVEPGDSGGANISPDGYALGVTSGASTNYDPNSKSYKCWSKFGYANESYYQPVGEALTANGLRLFL
jgi:alpha-lytic protease prodomain-containing protein/trypsin